MPPAEELVECAEEHTPAVVMRATSDAWTLAGRPLVFRDGGRSKPLRRDNRLGRALELYARTGCANLSSGDVRKLNAALSLTLHGAEASVRFAAHKKRMAALELEPGSAGVAWEAADNESE